MATRLTLYNGALLILGSRKLASLSENREPRRVMDDIYNRGAIRTCLSAGQWKFALRTAMLEYSPSVEPQFGFRYAFDKASDWIRTAALCSDEFFSEPLLEYSDEGDFLYSDTDPMYAKWVSDEASYGGDLSKWPENFARYVEHYFAHQACERLTQGRTKKLDLEKDMAKWLTKAASTDAMDDPTKMLPPGSWSRARHRGMSGRRDRGPRNRLIG